MALTQGVKPKTDKGLAGFLKLILGLAFLLCGGVLIAQWWGFFLTLAKGCLGLIFIFAGIITLALARE